jgi:hypothetical protein
MDIEAPPILAAGDVVPPLGLPPPAIDPMDLELEWIGFGIAATRERIQIEGFESFEDLNSMKEKDIRDLAESYGRRTIGDGRFIFGICRTKYLIGLIHWVQDFARINGMPSMNVFHCDPAAFRTDLDLAYHRADVRKAESDQSDTVSKAADPGKFKDKRKWAE